MKKDTFRLIAEAIHTGKLKNVKLPTGRFDHRKLTVDEIKSYIKEEFEKAKETSDVEVQDPELGWQDAEIENEIEWIKKLNIKEYFDK